MPSLKETGTITLGGQPYRVISLQFSALRVIGEHWDAVWKGSITDPEVFDKTVLVYAAALGRAKEEVLAIPASFKEILDGLWVIGEVSGLVIRKDAAGPLDLKTTSSTGD